MRALLILAGLAAAAPALAQIPPAPVPNLPAQSQAAATAQYSALLVQQEQMRQQLIQQQNDLARLDAQMRTEKAIADIQAARNLPPLPPPDVSGAPPYPQIDTSQLPSISDKTLQESDKRVRDAAGPQD